MTCAFSDEDELDPVSELVEAMFDKLVKTRYNPWC